MYKIYDDVFDKKWLDDISHILMNEPWVPNNIANRKTWPYGDKGTHLLLGNMYFYRNNENIIKYNQNINLSYNLINSFSAIENKVKRKMKLMEISTNLQFKEMDGTLHVDGTKNQSVFILMLANEYILEDIGGEYFHQPTNEKIKFKHGRLIEHDGEDLHLGLAFNKPYVARMSVKFVGENV